MNYDKCGNILVSPRLPCFPWMSEIDTKGFTVELKLNKSHIDIIEVTVYKKTNGDIVGVHAEIPCNFEELRQAVQSYVDLAKTLEAMGLLDDIIIL